MKNICCMTVLILLLLTAGCKKDTQILSKEYPYIIQEEVSEINTTGATVNAGLISSGEYSFDDFGFVISTHTKPVMTDRKISMKSLQERPDKLTLRIDNDLASDHLYYIRAYVKTTSTLVYSNERSFSSMGCIPPRIDHLSISSGIPGNVVTIAGNYFSETPGHNIVSFANARAQILYEGRDTIVVQCPNTSATNTVAVSVEVAGHTGFANSMFNLVNPWTPLADFPGGARFWSSSFTLGDRGYVLLGLAHVNSLATKELWEYNSLTSQWQELPEFPGEVRGMAIDFAIGNSGYAGLGVGSDITALNDLWEYNPQANSWTKKADYPGSTFNDHVYPHFVIDGKLYLYTAFNKYEFWTYDPAMDEWTQLPFDEQLKNHYITEGFSTGNTGYFIETSGDGWGPKTIILWQYNPAQNKIVKTDSVPTSSTFIEGCSFNIGRKLFLSARDQVLIEYDLDSKLVFYHNHPSDHNLFNFSMVFNNKAIVNNSETSKVFDFNTAAALKSK
jgi:N-acetylneuraminic acid mutarotase